MGYTLSCRTCQRISPEQEAAIRSAADSFNYGRTWVLTFRRDERDGHLICGMKPADMPDERVPKWPGPYEARDVEELARYAEKTPRNWPPPYEAKGLLNGLCGISRDCNVDWEIHASYSLRPVGSIRDGEGHFDPEAHAEASLAMGEVWRRWSKPWWQFW